MPSTMIRTTVTLAACLLLSTGFVLPESEPDIDAETFSSYQSWIGRYSDELRDDWGEPTKIKTKRNGIQVFVYKLQFHEGVQEVNASGQYFDTLNQPRNAVGSDVETVSAVPAATIRGTVGTKKTGKGNTTFKFFADEEDRIYQATRKPKR